MDIEKFFSDITRLEDARANAAQSTERKAVYEAPRPSAPPSLPTSKRFFEAVAQETKSPLLTKAELAAMKVFQTRYDKAMRDLEACTMESAHAKYKAQVPRLREQVLAGESIKEAEAWSLADYQEEARVKRRAAKEALRQISREAAEFLRPVFDRISSQLAALAAEESKAERARAARFDVLAADSVLTHTLRGAAYYLPKRLDILGSWTDPRLFLTGLADF
ncbi:MAG TPA: hypothetical protein VEH27_12115 [Methylomirabilota bacterium]|nr:hypothetical protein [Methylomirabilota bacterium]